jgi:hypothetical protein
MTGGEDVAQLRCENVTDGLRPSEAVASFRDLDGRKHFIRVERDFLSRIGVADYLPVGVIHVRSDLVLIELPHEAETGANRLWVKQSQMDSPIEVMA